MTTIQTKILLKKVKVVTILTTTQMKSMIQEATLSDITGDLLNHNIQTMKVTKMKSFHFYKNRKKPKYSWIIMYISFLKI
jgi:hypothetical protein